MSTTQDKPRGKCTGCAFEYQLTAARSGEHKGSLVIRKHNSRTGPGLCSGAGLPPRVEEPVAGAIQRAVVEAVGLPPRADTTDPDEPVEGPCISAEEAEKMNGADDPHHVAKRRKNPDLPETNVHRGPKEGCTETNCLPLPVEEAECRHPKGFRFVDDQNGRSGDFCLDCGAREECAEPKKHCRPGGCRGCCGCSAVCTKNPCGDPEGYGMHESTNRAIEALERRRREKWETAAREARAMAETIGKATGSIAQGMAEAVGKVAGSAAQVEAVASGAVPVVDPDVAAVPEMFTDPAPTRAPLFAKPKGPSAGYAEQVAEVLRSEFADPAPVAAEMAPVSGQPEPDRDRWGRYVLHKQPHTRATSFAKLGSSTFALGEWNERMLIKGLTERPDLLAMAHGLDVRADKTRLNAIADDAQTHAGNKVAANIGTSLHAFTERLDAGLITLDEVPPMWRARCKQYLDAVAAYGLRTQADWIERTTAVRADQVSAPLPVAGTLDRIWGVPNGDLVIGDLKSGRDLSYSWAEIAVQLALYAHGVNTFGLFDWNTKTWQKLGRPVRTDFAIVMHLPAEGDGCDLYRVDLVKGWEYAQVSGLVQSRQKDKSIAGALTTLDVQGAPAPPAPTGQLDTVQVQAHLLKASELVSGAAGGQELSQIYEYAQVSGLFSGAELERLKAACAIRYAELYPGA